MLRRLHMQSWLVPCLTLAHQAGIGVSPLGFPPITSFEHVELLEGHWLELRACRLVLVHVHDSMVCKIEMNSTTKRAHSFPLLVLDESIVYSTALGTAVAGPTYGNGMVKMHMSLWSDKSVLNKSERLLVVGGVVGRQPLCFLWHANDREHVGCVFYLCRRTSKDSPAEVTCTCC